MGGAADRDRGRGGAPGRLRRGLQAAEAPDPARSRRRARDALIRLRGARRLPLPGRRAGTRRHDSRARRRPRRLPRPRRLRPPRHGSTPRRGPRAEGGRRDGDRRPPARAPRQSPRRRGCARARPQRRRDAGGGRLLTRTRARALWLRAGADPGGDRTARPPRAGRDAAATAPPGGLADRLAVRLGRHVGVAAAALGRKAAPGRLRLLRPRLARLQAGAVRGCLRARDGAPRPHHLRDVGRGAAGPADQEDREPAARRRHLPGREGAGVEARAGRPRWHLPRRRLVHPLVRKRHHPPPPRRVVPRPVRLGAQAVARGGAQPRYRRRSAATSDRSSNGS